MTEVSGYPYAPLPRQEVDALGISTSYTSAGNQDQPLVVLLHGMSASADAYRETMHELANDFWLIAPDLPGYGFSGDTLPYTLTHLVEWLAAFRDALELPPMRLVGHSFGGALAARYCLAYPEDVIRLMLVAPAVKAGTLLPDFLKRVGLTLGLVELGEKVSEAMPLTIELVSRSIYDPEGIEQSVWPRRMKEYEMERADGDVLKALAFLDMGESLKRISQPTLIVWGADDPVLPVAHAQQIAASIPNAQLVIWDRCGHLPFLEKPVEFQQVARAFLSGKELT
ncbi:MAG: alpha/beta fold hydrolase [Candidatus Promineifilaceae bacterium]